MRQTVFPGILVDSIEIEKPPFDQPGVIQEFVGRGVTKDFETLQQGAEFSSEIVDGFIREAENMIGPLRDTYRIKYNLIIRSSPEVTNREILNDVKENFANRSVSSRARIFTRAKNTFEPDLIQVSNPVVDEQLSTEEIGRVYQVTTTVTK